MADERRSALADMSGIEQVSSCGHSKLNRAGDCYDCDARAQEIQ